MSELIDNRTRRITTLKAIIQHLDRGEAPDLVRNQLREIVRQTDAPSARGQDSRPALQLERKLTSPENAYITVRGTLPSEQSQSVPAIRGAESMRCWPLQQAQRRDFGGRSAAGTNRLINAQMSLRDQ